MIRGASFYIEREKEARSERDFATVIKKGLSQNVTF